MASIARGTTLRQACRSLATLSTPVSRSTIIPAKALWSSSIASQQRTFQNSAKRSILPPLPQVIQGTANDPAPTYPPSPTHGSYHWVFERTVSAALIPLTIAPFAAGTLNPIMDAVLCGAIIIHSHIGFQSIIIDYVPTSRLPKTRVFFMWALRAATLATALGLYEFETNDVGVTEAIKKIWTA